jgi:hypothetical protein
MMCAARGSIVRVFVRLHDCNCANRSRRMTVSHRYVPLLVNGVVAVVALSYAWVISETRYAVTGLQFVSPLAVILLLHLGWLAFSQGLAPGFALVAMRRAVMTAIVIAVVTLIAAVYAPMPTSANSDSTIANVANTVAMVLFCMLVIALVFGAVGMVTYAIALVARAIYRAVRGPKGPTDTRLFDVATLALTLAFIGGSSLEGITPALTYWSSDVARSSVVVAAPVDRVWQHIGKATSPDFPLPVMLHSIPRPVAVVTDEGAALGARRVVRFRGREGEGDLSLRVVQRTDSIAIFEVKSDESPIAYWVRHKDITFRVERVSDTTTRLTVALSYERLLSPAWFFRPYMHVAASLAMGVLARDTKARAEQPLT